MIPLLLMLKKKTKKISCLTGLDYPHFNFISYFHFPIGLQLVGSNWYFNYDN